MKKKLIIALTLFTIIIFSFAGCRKLGSASSAGDLNSTISGAVSKVESEGKSLGSAVSGAVSGVVSAVTSSK